MNTEVTNKIGEGYVNGGELYLKYLENIFLFKNQQGVYLKIKKLMNYSQ